MKVELLHYTPLEVCVGAVRTCWASQDKSDSMKGKTCQDCDQFISDLSAIKCSCGSYKLVEETWCGPNDKALIDRVGNKFKHASTLEHLTYNFFISDISRALLQEAMRHRMASPSVKSTRYTLKELKEFEEPIIKECSEEEYNFAIDNGVDCAHSVLLGKFYYIDQATLEQFLVMTDDSDVNICSALALENMRLLVRSGKSNDKSKYALPESYITEYTWSINARSLQNFIHLRSSKDALWEIRDLANMVFEALPEEHKYLFENNLCVVE